MRALGVVLLIGALLLLVGCAVMQHRAVQGAAKLAVVSLIERSSEPAVYAARVYRFIGKMEGVLVPTASVSIEDLEGLIRKEIRESSLTAAEKVVVNDLASALLEDFLDGLGENYVLSANLGTTQIAKARYVLGEIRSAVQLTGH